MRTAEVTRIFAEIRDELVPLIAELRDRDVDDSFLTGDFPVDRQVALDHEVVDLFGHRPDTWRIDPTEHPFASGAGIDDIRITTHYYPDALKSIFSTMHEYGHGLYQHQLPRDVAHLPVGSAGSLGLHESQSRLWENMVGRSLPFWRFFYPRVQELFPEALGDVELERFYAGINKAQPSLIRIEADEVTYGMHVILRFELEQDIVNGRVELRDLPRRWAEKMEQYLGIEVPDDAHGVLQDVHWGAGLIGYFSTYLLGTVMSVQIWEKVLEDVPDLEEQIERGEFTALREWLEVNIHAQGRKYPPQEILRRAVGTHDRRKAVPRVPQEEVRRAGHRLDRRGAELARREHRARVPRARTRRGPTGETRFPREGERSDAGWPRVESNHRAQIRSLPLYPLSYGARDTA